MSAGRTVRRGVVALVLGWLAVMVGSLLLAPSASAAPTATVYIRDLTPPIASVDQNGIVTFINQIQPKNVQVGGGGLVPTLVSATVNTDVTLALPSGKYTLQSQPDTDPNPGKGSSVAEKFAQSCVTCTITYTYRVTFPIGSVAGALVNQLTMQALAQMPQNQVVTYNGKQTTVQIGVPTPFIVNTLLPLPNLPGVNLPNQLQVTVPNPGGVSLPGGGVGLGAGTLSQTITTTTTTVTRQGIAGTPYTYNTGVGAPQLMPTGGGAPAFDQTSFSSSSGTSSYGATLGSGSGGRPGAYDGGSVPVFGVDGTKLASASSTTTQTGRPLSVPALIGVVLLVGVVAALLRMQQVRRSSTRR
jgi:hypothetical protein